MVPLRLKKPRRVSPRSRTEVVQVDNITGKSDMGNGDSFNQDYRHFDSLIWQVPAWSSAVFSFSTTSAVIALANRDKVELALRFDGKIAVAVFLFCTFAVLILLTSVFLRFRLHQRAIHRPNRKSVPSRWFIVPGQSALLLVLFVESSFLLLFALATSGLNIKIASAASITFMVVGYAYVEWSIRKLSILIKSKRDPDQTG